MAFGKRTAPPTVKTGGDASADSAQPVEKVVNLRPEEKAPAPAPSAPRSKASSLADEASEQKFAESKIAIFNPHFPSSVDIQCGEKAILL